MKLEQWCTTWWHQFKVLILRGLRERRFEAFNKLRTFQVISVAILGGLLWWHTPSSHIDDRVSISYDQIEPLSVKKFNPFLIKNVYYINTWVAAGLDHRSLE